jgi:hypothetical protein
MSKQKLVLYKPSGTTKQYDDVSILVTDKLIRLINLPDGRGTSISVGMIRFRNNQNGEEIATTLPYTLISANPSIGKRTVNATDMRAEGTNSVGC